MRLLGGRMWESRALSTCLPTTNGWRRPLPLRQTAEHAAAQVDESGRTVREQLVRQGEHPAGPGLPAGDAPAPADVALDPLQGQVG